MSGRVKRTVAVAIFSCVYAAALPLCLYFLYARPKAQSPPDLKTLTFDDAYTVQYDVRPSQYGFDDAVFAAEGYLVEQATAYWHRGEKERYRLEILFTDGETYHIALTVYAASLDGRAFGRYERRVVGGKPIGFSETGDPPVIAARYFDAATKRTYYVEPLTGFREAEYRFLELLTAL